MDTLETSRLLIRPFGMDDLTEAHQLLDIDLQWAGPSFSLEQRRNTLQREICLAEWADTGKLYGYRAILRKETSQLIGICGVLPIVWSPAKQALFWPTLFPNKRDASFLYASPELELGYALSRHFRGQGYATESVQVILRYVFDVLEVQRVFATTNRQNQASIALMRRIGMRVAINPHADWPGAAGVIENREKSYD